MLFTVFHVLHIWIICEHYTLVPGSGQVFRVVFREFRESSLFCLNQ
jgi:hypothetical protein